jgi:hypothetical protein
MNYIDKVEAACAYDRAFEARKWCDLIPPLEFPSTWKIKMVPPFGGALARFCVVTEFGKVSVYLDAYDQLGCMDNKPYWEIYPGSNEYGDPDRFQMNETTELIDGIKKSIDKMKPNDVI